MLALRTNDTSSASLGDDRLGAHLATRHLLDLGHRRIGLVGGPSYASTARDREAGYRDALTEAGVPVDETLLAGDSFSMQSGEIAGRTLLDRTDRPTAIFAVNDNNAIGVMAAAHALGLRVPDDLSLVGYNDIPVVSRLPVPLTTVRVPFPQIAANALELLREAGNDNPPRTLIAAPTLIPRKSAVACTPLSSCGSTRWRSFGTARHGTAPDRSVENRALEWAGYGRTASHSDATSTDRGHSDCHRRCPSRRGRARRCDSPRAERQRLADGEELTTGGGVVGPRWFFPSRRWTMHAGGER